MEKIDRELLIKEISSRLPYGVKAQVLGWDEEKGEIEVPLKIYSINTDGYISFEYNHYSVETVYVEDCRLYLRPLSSMTEEEKEELKQISNNYLDEWENTKTPLERWKLDAKISYLRFVFYNSHHIDWNGLISKELAIAATEEMYKTE